MQLHEDLIKCMLISRKLAACVMNKTYNIEAYQETWKGIMKKNEHDLTSQKSSFLSKKCSLTRLFEILSISHSLKPELLWRPSYDLRLKRSSPDRRRSASLPSFFQVVMAWQPRSCQNITAFFCIISVHNSVIKKHKVVTQVQQSSNKCQDNSQLHKL